MGDLDTALNSNDPRLAKYRALAKEIGDTQEEFTAWVDRLFDRWHRVEEREAAAGAREAALAEREKALATREKALAARLARAAELAHEPA